MTDTSDAPATGDRVPPGTGPGCDVPPWAAGRPGGPTGGKGDGPGPQGVAHPGKIAAEGLPPLRGGAAATVGTSTQRDPTAQDRRRPDMPLDRPLSGRCGGEGVLHLAEGGRMLLRRLRTDQEGCVAATGQAGLAAGTPILTPAGWCPVEAIRPGDRVCTSAGALPVIWVGHRSFDPAAPGSEPGQHPIHMPIGAFGNHAVLRLAPQQPVLLAAPDGRPVLVPAAHLARLRLSGCRVAQGVRRVVYHHLLLPRHAILFAAGAPVASLYPDTEALRLLGGRAPLQIMAALCRLGPGGAMVAIREPLNLHYGPCAFPLLSCRDPRRNGPQPPPARAAAIPLPSRPDLA